MLPLPTRGAHRVGLVTAAALTTTTVTYLAAGSATMRETVYLTAVLGAAAAAAVGAARAPRHDRTVPVLVACGLAMNALGDVTWQLLRHHGLGTEISAADVWWYGCYVALGASLWVVLRRNHDPHRAHVDAVLDAVTVAAVSILVFWSTAVEPIVDDERLSETVRLVWAGYPVADAILLALVARVLLDRQMRGAIGASFAVGVSLWLGADVAHLYVSEEGATGQALELLWIVSAVLIAGVSWRRDDVAVVPDEVRERDRWAVQLLIAVGPLIVPPALELVVDLRERADRPGQLLVGTCVLGALGFFRASRSLRAERVVRRRLQEARDAALEASEVKSLFVANMSHEIRTPLTTVLAASELLEETDLDPVQRRLVARMHRSGTLLQTLVERVLDFSRLAAGQVDLQVGEVVLATVLDDVQETYRARAAHQGLDFSVRLDPRAPRTITSDHVRVLQLLTNLLDNAFKFTPAGSVHLEVLPATDQRVLFVVSDTGIGIDVDDQPLIFESFRQVDGTATRSAGGSGLGLAICRELAAAMGGSISLESSAGRGSTFRVVLPRLLPSSAPVVVVAADDTPSSVLPAGS